MERKTETMDETVCGLREDGNLGWGVGGEEAQSGESRREAKPGSEPEVKAEMWGNLKSLFTMTPEVKIGG